VNRVITEADLRRHLARADAGVDPDGSIEQRLLDATRALGRPATGRARVSLRIWIPAAVAVAAVVAVSAAVPRMLNQDRSVAAGPSVAASTGPAVRIDPLPIDPLAGIQPASPSTVTVDVLNKTATPQLSRNVATLLKQAGFGIGQMANADTCAAHQTCAPISVTELLYPPGMEAAAEAVRLIYPYATPRVATEVSTVTLRLGTDTDLVPWPDLTGEAK
jgi:hypothetical protein